MPTTSSARRAVPPGYPREDHRRGGRRPSAGLLNQRPLRSIAEEIGPGPATRATFFRIVTMAVAQLVFFCFRDPVRRLGSSAGKPAVRPRSTRCQTSSRRLSIAGSDHSAACAGL